MPLQFELDADITVDSQLPRFEMTNVSNLPQSVQDLLTSLANDEIIFNTKKASGNYSIVLKVLIENSKTIIELHPWVV